MTKMSLFILLVVGFFYVCQSVPAPGHGALKGYCSVGKHCNNHMQCCVSNTRPIGRRKRASSLDRFVKGKCEPLGGLGDACIKNGRFEPQPGGLYYESCPCRPGLTCVGTGVIDVPLGEIGRCQRNGKGSSLTSLQ